MSKPPLTSILLSLFTTPERAESIEGDLMEERLGRGNLWFQLQVIRITFSLFQQSFLQAPLQTSVLSTATFGLLFGAVLVTANILELIWVNYAPHAFLMFLMAIMITGMPSFLMGMILIRSAPVLGVRAVASTTLLIFLAINLFQLQGYTAIFQLEIDVGLGAGVAILIGVVLTVLATLLITFQAILPIILGSIVARRLFPLRQNDTQKLQSRK